MPPTKNQAETADLFDANMLRLLKQGGKRVLVHHPDGSQSVELVDFTAADLNAFAKRLRDVGATGTLPGSDAEIMRQEFTKRMANGSLRLGPIPPLDTQTPDAATG